MDQPKRKSKIPAFIIGLISLLMLFTSMFSVLNRPIYEISVFTLMDEYDNQNGNQFDLEQFKSIMLDFTEILDSLPQEDRESFEELAGFSFDTITNLADDFSINSMIDFVSATKLDQIKEIEGIEEIEKIEGLESFGQLIQFTEASIEFLYIIRILIIACAIFIAFFLLLGVLFRVKTLTILSMIFSLPYFAILAGLTYLILFFALCIIHMILIPKKIKKNAAVQCDQPA